MARSRNHFAVETQQCILHVLLGNISLSNM